MDVDDDEDSDISSNTLLKEPLRLVFITAKERATKKRKTAMIIWVMMMSGGEVMCRDHSLLGTHKRF